MSAATTIDPADGSAVKAAVSEYYGKDLTTTGDLKTSACLTSGETTAEVARLLRNVHPDVQARFYGCGSPLPPLLKGATVLDLGCGTGRDSFVAAQLVGPEGRVIGVDMTPEQLELAESTEDWHAAKFGYAKPNTLFVAGDIANLARAGIKDASIDVVISNCVLNLAADKKAVFKEIFRVLKPGGELYFSDVYASKRVPEALQRDKVLWGECLSGALYKGDFARIMRSVGFSQWWTVTSRVIDVDDSTVAAATKGITFFSETVRAFKVPAEAGLEEGDPEDYGQHVVYNGTASGQPHAFTLGASSCGGAGGVFITDAKTPVDGNTAKIIAVSRYASALKVNAARDHRGPYCRAGGAAAVPVFVGGGGSDDGGSSSASCCPPKAGAAGGGKCC